MNDLYRSIFDDMVIFSMVARTKSFTKASLILNIPKSTVSNKIKNLEKYLQVQLLNRNTRIVALTETGLKYYQTVSKLVEQAVDIHQTIQKKNNIFSGRIKLSVPVDFV